MAAGRMFRSRPSDRCCSDRRAVNASSRCLANSTSSVKKIVPPTTTLRASSMPENHSGSGDGMPSATPMNPDARKIVPKATNHRTPARTPSKTSAPSGARMPQMPGEPPGRKPPRAIIDSVGANRMSQSWMLRSRRKLAVRAKIAMDAIEISSVKERHRARPGTESEVQAGPQERDRQDQDRDPDEQRLTEARVMVVERVGADLRDPVQDAVNPTPKGRHPAKIGAPPGTRPLGHRARRRPGGVNKDPRTSTIGRTFPAVQTRPKPFARASRLACDQGL